MVDWSNVAETLCELIKDETGISITTEEMGFNEGNQKLSVTLFDEPFMEIASEEIEDRDEEDTAYHIFESMRDPVKQITAARITFLTKNIEPIFNDVLEKARSKTGKTYDLSFRLENMGYLARARHYLTERETDWDYPDIYMIIEKDDETVELQVDPYQSDEPIDKTELIEKIQTLS